MKKKIAWGASKLLKLCLANNKEANFFYCIDDFTKDREVCNLPIMKSSAITKEKKDSFQIIVFAVSNKSLKEISIKLNSLGLIYGKDYIYYSDYFYENFLKKAESILNFKFNSRIYRYALSFTLNSKMPIHTTILGTWLFLEILNSLNNIKGQIAEVGAYQGGNSLCALNFMTKLSPKTFYILDSFEGFPELNSNDPSSFKKGDYNIETAFEEILDTFSIFPEAKVIKGFVPNSFSKIPANEKFSLVFYDCDLYQPALDTFNFFWDRILPGGYLLIHDYEAEEGGFTGVKKATKEFFADKNVKLFSFFENTMGIVKKNKI
jgi:hypothetical protein